MDEENSEFKEVQMQTQKSNHTGYFLTVMILAQKILPSNHAILLTDISLTECYPIYLMDLSRKVILIKTTDSHCRETDKLSGIKPFCCEVYLFSDICRMRWAN